MLGVVLVQHHAGAEAGRVWPRSSAKCLAAAASSFTLAPPDKMQEQLVWNLEAQRLGGLAIDGQFELRWLLNGKIGRLLALKNAIDIRS
jgi:hypothetical protein